MGLLKSIFRLYFSPDTYTKTLRELFNATSLENYRLDNHRSKIVTECYNKAMALYSKGQYGQSFNTISEILESLKGTNNMDLYFRLLSISGMIVLRAGNPDMLLNITQTLEKGIDDGKLKETSWFFDTLFVSAGAAMMYADQNKDNNGYIVALRWLGKLHDYNVRKNIFDKALYILTIECNYKLSKKAEVKFVKDYLYKNISKFEINEINDYFRNRGIII